MSYAEMTNEGGGEGGGTGRCVWCTFVCAATRIMCFSCIRYVCPCCCPSSPPSKPEFSLLCLGLSGAGKTTLLSLLAGEPTDCIESTPGFTVKAFITPSASYSIKELGGMESIRPYWSKYYGGQHAIIFVVDSCCSTEVLCETKTWFENCVRDTTREGPPLLVLCNKQDKENAKSAKTLSEELELNKVCHGRKLLVKECNHKDINSLHQALESLVGVMTDDQ